MGSDGLGTGAVRPRELAGVASVPALLLVWLILTGRELLGPVSLGFYLIANLIVFVDFLDMFVRVCCRRAHTGWRPAPTSVLLDVGRFTPYQIRLLLRPYCVLASVHNAADELDDFLEGLGPLRERLWVIDDASTDDTWFRLKRSGVRCVRGGPNRKKPGAIKELIRSLPPEVVTLIVIDPDARFRHEGERGVSSLERVIFDFQRSGRAAVCPRLALQEDGWLGRLQALEYAMSFSLGRKSLGGHGVTSGISIYRRDALERALQEHTLSVYAEDLENALILMKLGESVYYDERLVVETEAKRTWRAWFSQRVGWSYGLLKVYCERFADLWRSVPRRFIWIYQYFVYIGLFSLLFHPLKVAGLVLIALSAANGVDHLLGLDLIPDTAATSPTYFLFAYLKCTALAMAAVPLAALRGEGLRLLPAVPVYFFYALAQIPPATVGYLNWLSLRLRGQRLYRDHYTEEEFPEWRSVNV